MEKMERNIPRQNHLELLRHLKDIDDLRDSRDSGIESGQESYAEEIAQRIIADAEKSNAKIIILFASTKRRSTESANLIAETLRKVRPEIKVIVSPNSNLIDLDHGEYVLPTNYKVGDQYEPFKIAWEAFLTESFDRNNPDYRFGDPKINPDGTVTYPALSDYFTKFGESQIDINLRLYKAIVDGYNIKDRIFSEKILNIVLTHSLPYATFKHLAEVARKIKEEGFTFEKGTLYKVCWDIYNDDKESQHKSQYGDFSEVQIDLLEDEKFINMLKDEIQFLEGKFGK